MHIEVGRINDVICRFPKFRELGTFSPNTFHNAKALSQHYVEVTFTEPAGSGAASAVRYKITASDSTGLPVLDAQLSADGMKAVLTTGGQQDVE